MEPSAHDTPSLPQQAIEEIQGMLKSFTEHQLLQVLENAQRRLGMPNERPEDLETARAAVHQLNNLRTAHRLRRES